ncbi:carbohydrate binding family 9 domain-containing protein [bacterium]|nr:carbohydrate binding family 9 domain-containing protein [bacterium]
MFAWVVIILLVAVTAASADEQFRPQYHPVLDIPRMSGEIKIDGEIDDSGWKSAALAANFAENDPGDQVRPPVNSEVYVTYDDANFYLLFKAYDDPATIRATLAERDNIWQDDYFGIIFDTYGDKAWAYEMFVNPFGVQGDLRWNRGNEDMSYDLVWYSQGKITSEGYQVEVAIPFRSLRFPNREEQAWTVNFWRNHPRDSRRRYSWAAMDRDNPCWLCNFGTLRGIKNVTPGGKVELLPSMVGFQSGELVDYGESDQRFDNHDPDAEIGLNLKYNLATDLTAEGTINPDFSQVESDATQIDVNSTFALYFSERRPFFQEGSDLFDTYFDVVYTRTIKDPEFAGKLYGRLGRTSVAYIAAQDENAVVLVPGEERSWLAPADKAFSNILRVKQTILENSFVGATFTDRRLDGGGSGSVLSADGSVRFTKNWSFEFQTAASHTDELDSPFLGLDSGEVSPTFDNGKHTVEFDGESFWGHAVYASVERNARTWNVNIDYYEYSPRFRADNGFVSRVNSREVSAWTGLLFRYDKHPIFDMIEPQITVARVWDFDKRFQDEWVIPGMYVRLKGQTQIDMELLFSRERFRDTVIAGIRRFGFYLDSRFSKPVSAGFNLSTGHSLIRFLERPILGQTLELDVWSRIKLTRRLTIEPQLGYFQADFFDDVNPDWFTDPQITPGQRIVSAWVMRTYFNYQFSRPLNLRLIVEYFDEENDYELDNSARALVFEPLLTYELNPFTIFYIGSSHDYTDYDYTGLKKVRRSSQRLFVKLQYLFRT